MAPVPLNSNPLPSLYMERPLKAILESVPYEYRLAISAAVHALAEADEEITLMYGRIAVGDCQRLIEAENKASNP